MKKSVLKPIVLGVFASAVIVGCSSNDPESPREKPACNYNISGGNTVDIMFGTAYSDPGINVTQAKDGSKVTDVKKEGAVDTSKLGAYEVVYSSESCSNKETRTVTVVESSCAYKLLGSFETEVALNGTYNEAGVEVKDINNKAVEYKITGTVDTSKEDAYTLIYQGIGCDDSQKRVVTVKAETTACNYELNGNADLVIALNAEYTDLGVIVETAKDHVTVDNIELLGDAVDPKVAKEYKVIYQGEGCSNDIERTVTVKAPVKCTYTLVDDKPYTLIVGRDYNEPGFSIKNASGTTITTGIAVDTIEKDKIGEYKVTYQDTSCNNSATRVVNVVAADCTYSFVDEKNPLILKKGTVYTDVKPTVKNADGADIIASDITVKSNNVETVVGSYEVVYESKGCPNTATRKVEIIPLVCIYTPKAGPATVITGHSYTDPGVTISPDVTVTVTGSIDTSVLGKQSIKYQGESCENSVERFVEVVKPGRPDPKTVLPNI